MIDKNLSDLDFWMDRLFDKLYIHIYSKSARRFWGLFEHVEVSAMPVRVIYDATFAETMFQLI